MEDLNHIPPEEENGVEDRISAIPDDVLLNNILSRLPTQTVVFTHGMSSRWRHLWKRLQVLDFCDESFASANRFSVFVSAVLTFLRDRPRDIKNMRLHCAYSVINDYGFRVNSVYGWIIAVIGAVLQELDLRLYCDDADEPDFTLPSSLFTCPNLVSLSIRDKIHLHLSKAICLPSLKTLLINIHSPQVASVNALLCGCPKIENLNLSLYDAAVEDIIFIPSTLKKLNFYADSNFGGGPSLEINAPHLEYLPITQSPFRDVSHKYNLHDVLEATLDLYPMFFGLNTALLNLLDALSRTKHLVLSATTTKWLFGKSDDQLFQKFRCLLRLELMLPSVNTNALLYLLQNCPKLQVLKIQCEKVQSPILGWDPQPSDPNCLVSHLASIEFKGFQGLPDEMEFVENVLQKGLVLKTLIISDLDQSKKYDILKRLSNMPRASGMCQLLFD